MIKEKFISQIAITFGLLLMLYACNAEDDGMSIKKQGTGFDISSTFVRLLDDSTQTAGYLDITVDTPELKLKWNTLPACNIDTTITTVKVSSGKYRLPIKWDKLQKDNLYGPITKAFEAGVTISDGVQSKYVRLFWTDGIDSTQIAKESEVMTRSGDEEREVIMLELLPTEEVIMDKNIGGAVYVDFSGVAIVKLDPTNLTDETHIDKSSLPKLITKPQKVDFEWENGIAPDVNFVKLVRFSASSSVYKDAVVTYRIPPVMVPKYEFISSSPVKGSILPATGANITITVNTNVPWSIEGDLGITTSVYDNDVIGIGNRDLEFPIRTNTGSSQRTVTVIVKSQDIAKDTLTFTQLAGTVEETLEYKNSTLPTGNIPQAGGTYGFVFEGSYTGSLQVRAIVDGVAQTPGTAVTNKQPQCTVPENSLTNERAVTFEYKQGDGNWAALPASTNRTQDASVSNTLTYVSSSLPAGNIPATATVYTFNFEGGYTGQLRVRSVDATTGAVLFNGPIGTTHSPKVTVPVNTSTNTRNIKFQYRLIDIAGSLWEDLPANTNRIQDANSGETGTVTPSALTPQGTISEWGQRFYCTFTGNFTGDIMLQAITDGGSTIYTGDTGKVGAKLSVMVEQLKGPNRPVTFQYSIDGGKNWIDIEIRDQINEKLQIGSLTPSSGSITDNIPVTGETFTITFSGTYSKYITLIVREDNSQGNIIAQEKSLLNGSHEFKLTIPANNTGRPRTFGFSYLREDLGKERMIVVKTQDYQ